MQDDRVKCTMMKLRRDVTGRINQSTRVVPIFSRSEKVYFQLSVEKEEPRDACYTSTNVD